MSNKSPWGDPVFTVRLPKPVISTLRKMAYEEARTPSEILRELVIDELHRKGYTIAEEPCEGQISM